MERLQMSLRSAESSCHVVIHAGSIILAIITQVISGILFLLTKDSSVPNAVFQTSSRNVSETFPLEVTLDWWSQCYWNILDLWSMAWLLHAVVCIFKRNAHGPESCNPEIHPPIFYLTWSVINTGRVCNMLMWDRHGILGAVTACWLVFGLSIGMLHISYSNLNAHKARLAISNPHMISWTRYLTQNGLAAFAWWSLLNAIVGLGILLKYKAGVADPLVSSIVLILISFCTIIWFILQSVLLKKYLRYTFTVYPLLVLGLGAMFTRSYLVLHLSANTVFCGFLMLLVTIMSCFHLICECMHVDTSSQPAAIEPYVRFENETVCQQVDNIKHKPQE